MGLEAFAKGLVFPIGADLTGMKTGLDEAQTELTKVEKSFGDMASSAGAKMTSMGTDMSLKVTAPIVAIGAASIYTAAQFDDSMRQVQATSGATGAEFDALREQARQLGADTAFSASEAAEGMNYLAAAGFDATQVMEAMPGMLSLASAGHVELGQAAEIASSILNGFNLEAEEAGRVADVLAKSAAATNAGVTDMGEAMSYVAPVAKATGLSLEEVAAAIGIMSNAGIKGSMAGTALRGSLTALMSPTDEAAGIMSRYNIEINTNQKEINAANQKYEDAANKLGGMETALENAKNKLKEMRVAGTFSKEAIAAQSAEIDRQKKSMEAQKDEMKRLETAAGTLSSKGMIPLNEIVKQFADSGMTTAEIMTIFGDRAGPGMLAMIQQGQGGLVDLTKELENSGGSAQEMAETMESGPGGAFRTLEGSMEDLAITLGDTLIPAIMPFVDILKELANWLSGLDKNTLTIIVTIAALAAAIGPLLIVLGMMASGIGSIIAIIPVLSAGLTLLAAHPIILAFVVIVGLLVLLELKFGILTKAAAALSEGVGWLSEGIGAFVDWVTTAVNWSDVLYNAFLILLGPIGWIQIAMNALGVSWNGVWAGMISITQGAASFIKGIMDTMVSGIKWAVNAVIDGVNLMIRGLNMLHFSVPSWVPVIGGQSIGFNLSQIPRLAEGGIVTEPTMAMIGESGPEAVVPLSEGSNAAGGITITGNTFNVRNDQDIKLIARELQTLITRTNRGRGIT